MPRRVHFPVHVTPPRSSWAICRIIMNYSGLRVDGTDPKVVYMDSHLEDIVGFVPFTLKVLYPCMVSVPPSQLLRPAETGSRMVLSVVSCSDSR